MSKFRNLFKLIKSDEYKRAEQRQKRKNARFAKLPIKKQRIQIAKDVLAMLGAKKINPASSYFRPSDTMYTGLSAARDPNNERTREVLRISKDDAAAVAAADPAVIIATMSGVACDVCGIGSLFVSAIGCANKVTMKGLSDKRDTGDMRQREVDYLKRWFDGYQLRAIENYYERRAGYGPIFDQDSDRKRLAMIMENIISNNGKFDPAHGKHNHRDYE